MVLGAIIVGLVGERLEVKKMLLFGTMGLGIFLAFVGFFPQVFAIYILIFLIGFCVSFLNVPTSTPLQKLVPDEMRGRVFGSFGALVQATSIVSMGFVGFLAEYVEVTWVIIGAGVLTFLIGILGFLPRIDLET